MLTVTRLITVASVLLITACSDDSADRKQAENNDGATSIPSETRVSKKTAYALENRQYLETNQAKDGVQVTESGLQYLILNEGDGTSPTVDDFVTVHFQGRVVSGEVFESSTERTERGEPITFLHRVGRLIPGLAEALTLMQVGDTWEVTIPVDLVDGGTLYTPRNRILIYDLELIEVMTAQEQKARQKEKLAEVEARAAAFRDAQLTFLEQNKGKDGVKTTESGLQYRVLEAGEGALPTAAAAVTVHYSGKLINGDEFDSSYPRGEPSTFGLNQVIKGWAEGLQLMKTGAKFEFYIPYDLGFGERGSLGGIPPFATLVFVVELISFEE